MAGIDSYSDLDELETDSDPLTERFFKAANHLQKVLLASVPNELLLKLYGYYKQALEGPCNDPKPSWYDVRGKAKWEAWKKLRDLSHNEAKTLYVATIEKLDPEFCCPTSATAGWVTVSTLQSSDDHLEENQKSVVDYVKEGDCDKLLSFLQSHKREANSILNEKDSDGLGLIHWAADRGSGKMLEILLSFGINVNMTDPEMQTALHYAASCGHVECVSLLLKYGADVNAKDLEGSEASAVATEDVRELLNNCKI